MDRDDLGLPPGTHFTPVQIAPLYGVYPGTVIRWIRSRRLRGNRFPGVRGRYWVARGALETFARLYPVKHPHREVIRGPDADIADSADHA